jgi:amidase
MTDLHDLTLLEQAGAVRRAEVSPVELAEHYLRRVDAHGEELGAFVTVTADRALDEARAAADRVAAAAADDVLPPLLGVPVPVKDLNMVEGVRVTFGSEVFRTFTAPFDDHVATKLRDAGTVLLGKTNTPEFGLPCYTENTVVGPARNPWDPALMAGGSSGGAAAAVAAGLAPAAHGNDGGGSVRIPAACCGLVGLKTSRGRISAGPLRGDTSGLPVEGALARSVRDAAALLDAMAGPMPGDPHWAPPLPPGETFLAACERPVGRLRVGRFRTPVIAETELHPDVVRGYEDASALLEGLGHDVEDVEPPFTVDAVAQFEQVWATGAASIPLDEDCEAQLMPLTRHLRDRGRRVSGPDYVAALAAMQLASRMAAVRLAAYDVLLCPTLAQPPLPVGAIRDDDDPAGDFEAQKRFTPFTAAFNVTGQPALSLPLSTTADGLPVGVMLVGRSAGEAALLALAAQVEAAAPWADRHPEGW